MAVKVSRFLGDQVILRHPQNPINPLVSVVMPTYKLRGDMNRRAIDSVLNQTFRDFEFIIVDDGSLDGLADFLKDYQRKDPRIVLVRHEINSGLPALRTNEGVLLARGKYIAYMFEDDFWRPQALEHLVSYAEKENRDCVIYGTTEYLIHTKDGVVPRRLGDWEFNYGELKHHNLIANCAVLHTKSAMSRCGMYDPNILIRRLSDYDLWLRMGKVIPFIHCEAVVGQVEAGTKYALGTSVDTDVALSYRYMSTERNNELHPDRFCEYEVDRIPFSSTPEDIYRIREHFLEPFWTQHPALLKENERKLAVVSRQQPNRVLVTKGAYATSIDVTLGNLARILPSDIHSQTFIPEEFLNLVKLANFDTLVCHKALDMPSMLLQESAYASGKTNIYLLDDNLFQAGLGYMAETFPYLQPGDVRYKNLINEVSLADLVFSYSTKITEDAKNHNPRVVQLKNTIREKFIIDAKPIAGGKMTGRRIKYALLTGPIRRRDLQNLWSQFVKFFSAHQNDVEFHVWGIDVAEFEPLNCPVYTRGFENSYDKYLDALSEEKFDFMICPLIDDHEYKMSKTPIKYLEGTAAGAVGIFSNAVIYQEILDGVTGIKTDNDHWTDALERSYALSDSQREELYYGAKRDILLSGTTESQVLNYLSAFEAADLHSQLRSGETASGKAKIAYFFHETILGGATLHLLNHALIAKSYGFEPIICFMVRKPLDPGMLKLLEKNQIDYVLLDYYTYTWLWYNNEESQRRAEEIVSWMKEQEIRMAHMVTYSAEVIYAASRCNIPLVATLHQHYDTPENFITSNQSILIENPRVCAIHSSSLRYTWEWSEVLNSPAFTIRAPISEVYFDEYDERGKKHLPAVPTLLVSGTLQPRKRQLEAIRAVKLLKDKGIKVKLILLGYDNLKADYVADCRNEVARAGLEEQVFIPGFVLDPKPYYDEADFVFCTSDDESMPQSILKAMASGMRVISTPVGGVKELILDSFSGIIADGYEPEDLANSIERAVRLGDDTWNRMVQNAHFAARMTCSEEVVRYKLLKLYNLAAQESKRLGGINSSGEGKDRETRFVAEIQTWPGRRYQSQGDVFARRLTALGLSYRLRIPNNFLNAIILTFGTYGHRYNHKIEITIRSASFPFQLFRQGEINGEEIYDNIPYSFYFDPIVNSAGKDVIVTVRGKDGQLRSNLSIYEKGARPAGLKRYLKMIDLRGGKMYGSLMFTSPKKEKDG